MRLGAWARGGLTAKAEPVTMLMPTPEPMPTVEMIRGDKRAQEVVK